jgi:hypothetical protein
MDNSFKKPAGYQPKKLWQWITTIAIILSLISGSFLLYRWWKTQQDDKQLKVLEQQLEQAEQNQAQASEQYQIQKNWVNLTTPLAQNPLIKQLFHNLCQIFADRYAKSKDLDNSHLPLYFGGFYQKSLSDGENQGEIGNCGYDEQNKLVIIKLNQLYLLNKLGHERYFATPELYLNIDFNTLTETLAHELAHYFQFVKYEQSSCESSGAKDNNGEFLAPELVAEHTQFTAEIKQMIINSVEYEKFKEWWNNPEA